MMNRRAMFLLAVCVPFGGTGCGGERTPLGPPPATDRPPTHATLDVAGRSVRVELAHTLRARERGLMGRTSLATDAGMLFLFTEATPQRFWMRDTLIPLDIAFLDADGRVINIEHGLPGVEQPGYYSAEPAMFVLEMEDGWCAEAGLEAGDRILVSEELRALAEPAQGRASPSAP
jgi:uncharacterized membrane protein (UPF0127 family)